MWAAGALLSTGGVARTGGGGRLCSGASEPAVSPAVRRNVGLRAGVSWPPVSLEGRGAFSPRTIIYTPHHANPPCHRRRHHHPPVSCPPEPSPSLPLSTPRRPSSHREISHAFLCRGFVRQKRAGTHARLSPAGNPSEIISVWKSCG